MDVGIAVGIAMGSVAPGIAVLDLNLCPVSKVTVDRHAVVALVLRNRTYSLVATDVLSHLHVVVVSVATLHRRDCPVELGIVLIHEHERVLPSQPSDLTVVLAGSPFVPVIEVDELRV